MKRKSKASPPTHDRRRLRPNGRSDDGNAFMPDPGDGPALAPDDLAEEWAEEFLLAATSGEEVGEDMRDAVTTEEMSGPFIETTGSEEFARGPVPGRQPPRREPFPTTHGPR